MLLTDDGGRRHIAPAIRLRHEPAAPGAARAAPWGAYRRSPGTDRSNATDATRGGRVTMVAIAKQVGPSRWREASAATTRIFSPAISTSTGRVGRSRRPTTTWFTLLTMNTHPLHFDAAVRRVGNLADPASRPVNPAIRQDSAIRCHARSHAGCAAGLNRLPDRVLAGFPGANSFGGDCGHARFPGQIHRSQSGTGTASHLITEMFSRLTGINSRTHPTEAARKPCSTCCRGACT